VASRRFHFGFHSAEFWHTTGSYYATQATYLGKAYLDLSFGRYYSGACSMEDLAGHLNIKAKSVPRLEAYLTGGA
jgi:hypothetical protein